MTNLTTSEARAEAAAIILKAMLATMPPPSLARLYAAARAESGEIGIMAIEDEVAWICRDDPAATRDLLARDECS